MGARAKALVGAALVVGSAVLLAGCTGGRDALDAEATGPVETTALDTVGDTGIPVQPDGTLLVADVAVWVEGTCPVPAEQPAGTSDNPAGTSETIQQTLDRLQSSTDASVAFEECLNAVAQPIWESQIKPYPVVSPDGAVMSAPEVISWVREDIGV